MSSYHCFFFIPEGVLLPESEARTYATSTEETVFDEIRRKSNDFPLINKLDFLESVIQKSELVSKNGPISPSSLNAAFGIATERNSTDTVADNMLASYMESVEVEKYTSSIQVGTEVDITNLKVYVAYMES